MQRKVALEAKVSGAEVQFSSLPSRFLRDGFSALVKARERRETGCFPARVLAGVP